MFLLLSLNHLLLTQDKLVLVMGCSTGLLAMLAIQAGARRVLSIGSMLDTTQAVVETNGMSASIQLELEPSGELANGGVDVIVAEVSISLFFLAFLC